MSASMSAAFLLRYRGQPMRFLHRVGAPVAEIVPVGMADQFLSEADAWHAAHQHHLRPEWVTVEIKNQNETHPIQL